MPLTVGAVFAGYSILRMLGAGAMGTVYLAQHPCLPDDLKGVQHRADAVKSSVVRAFPALGTLR